MRLAQPLEVVALSGIPAGNNAGGYAQAALDAVTPLVEERLGTPLAAASYTDIFSYNIPRFRKAFTPTSYRLTAGFIDPATFKLFESIDGLVLTDDGGTEVDAKYYRLDAVRGVLTLLRDVKAGSMVLRATYDAGFEEEGDGMAAEIPNWLKQAATIIGVRIMQMNPTGIVDKKVPIYTEVQNAFYAAGSTLINAHIRPRMELFWPDRVVVTNG